MATGVAQALDASKTPSEKTHAPAKRVATRRRYIGGRLFIPKVSQALSAGSRVHRRMALGHYSRMICSEQVLLNTLPPEGDIIMNYPKCSSLPLSAYSAWRLAVAARKQKTSNTDDDTPAAASEVSFELGGVSDPLLGQFFSKSIEVFGVLIVASENTPDSKVLHAAHVMAEYLDNDEDGRVDDDAVVASMVSEQATLVMFQDENEAESSGIFDAEIPEDRGFQDLYGEETNQSGRFDASLEEVLHLISNYGYELVYPEALGTERPTQLTEAMDLARGGYFASVPSSYPDEAWYHYDDTTCDYRCMAVEYFYWALTTKLGAQADPVRCAEIAVEWELCTPESLENGDPAITAILEEPTYKLPTVLPNGATETTNKLQILFRESMTKSQITSMGRAAIDGIRPFVPYPTETIMLNPNLGIAVGVNNMAR